MKKHLVPMKRTEIYCFVFTVHEQWTKIFASRNLSIMERFEFKCDEKTEPKEKLGPIVSTGGLRTCRTTRTENQS